MSAATGVPPLHRCGTDALIGWKHPIRAPHSISYNLLKEFKKKYRVKFYSMYEKGLIHLGPQDVMIGQPVPVGQFNYEARSPTDDSDSIVSRTIRSNPHNKNKFLIMPFANDEGYIGWAKRIAGEADGLILIGGEYWQKDLSSTPLGDLTKRVILGVNMAVDPKDYPLVKKRFNAKGTRKYLYIGHTGWYKNVAQLEAIAKSIPDFDGGHIGVGDVDGWKKISEFTELSPAFMRKVAEEYDISVGTSSADPQATTILEQMCFGFPMACTPQSGYEHSSILSLSVSDTALNRNLLMSLQEEDESSLQERARQNREYALRCHSWADFSNSVLSFIYEHQT